MSRDLVNPMESRTMIDAILPSWVKSAEAFNDPPVATVFPEEEALISGATEKRRREFRTARLCAHQAIRLLSLEPQPVLRGERGAPVWQRGVVGSITHCAGYRAAVVARDVLAIGIDAEPHRPVSNGLLARIATTAEVADLDRLGVEDPGRLLFSAKESIYKAWHPLTGRWLGFLDAVVTFNLEGSFTARITPPATATHLGPGEFTGRWMVSHGLVLTAVVTRTSLYGSRRQ